MITTSKWAIIIHLAILLFVGVCYCSSSQTGISTCIISDELDSFVVLAKEIADADKLPIFKSVNEALISGNSIILWVASPQFLSQKNLIMAGKQIANHAPLPSLGIITGTTALQARNLWKNGHRVSDSQGCIIDLKSIRLSGTIEKTLTANKENLLEAIISSGFICHRGHGAGNLWMQEKDISFSNTDIKPLSHFPVIISGGCQTFKPWLGNSIALSFINSGAAIYAGFMFSPAPDYLFGFDVGSVWHLSNRGFPIGLIVAMQNKAAFSAFSSFPSFFLLGDPRTYFNKDSVTLVRTISPTEKSITLHFPSTPPGIIPLRFVGGERYANVSIPGVGSSRSNTRIYHSKILTTDIGHDKYILFKHNGGAFSIALNNMPMPAFVQHILASFEYSFCYLPSTNGSKLLLILSLVFVAILGYRLFRQKEVLSGLSLPFVVSFAIFSLEMAYSLCKCGELEFISKHVHFNPLWHIANFLFLLAGFCFLKLYKNIAFRITGLVISTIPILAPTVFWGAGIVLLNIVAMQKYGTSIYNYQIPILSLTSLLCHSSFIMAGSFLIVRWARFKNRPN